MNKTTTAWGTEIRGTRFTFEHRVQFRNGTETLPYRSTQWWKTVAGALRAAEGHAKGMDAYYEAGTVITHALAVYSDLQEFVTNEAA